MKEETIKSIYEMLKWHFNEKVKRLWCATESLRIWKWWISLVSRATWVSRQTIYRWIEELNWDKELDNRRIRKQWWWRKRIDNNQGCLILS